MVTGEQEFMNGSSKVSGFLLLVQNALEQVVVAFALEQIGGRDFRQTHSVHCGSGAKWQTVSADLEEGNCATTTLDTAFPQQKFELHSGNVACY
jgi:hypothetical protein